MPEFNNDLNALLDARFPILISETHEESRLLARVRELCTARDLPLFIWSRADGLKRSTETSAVYNTSDFTDALKHVDATPQNGLYVFLDAHPFFTNPLNVRLMREIAFDHYRRDRTLLFVSPTLDLPPELVRMSARLAMPGITADRVRSLLKEELERWQRDTRRSLRIDRERRGFDPAGFGLARLVDLSDGYSGAEIEQAIVASQYAALADGGALTPAHIERELGQTKPLSVIRVEDFERLRTWASQRCVTVD